MPRREAQTTIRRATEAGIFDPGRKPIQRDGSVEVPVKRPMAGQKTVRQEHPEFYHKTPGLVDLFRDRDRDRISQEQVALLPRSWYILGTVITVKIDPRVEDLKRDIGSALLSIYPRCRCVLLDRGIEGQFRVPKREVIAGSGAETGTGTETETVHRENGVVFKLDAMKIMFSAGNLKERMRMSRLGDDEFVVDMFAGIGYFSLPMAVHSRPDRVLSIELNPLAYGYLTENVRLNKVEGIVDPVLGDCAEEVPVGEADRVVMGFVEFTDRYLKEGIRALRPGGTLHYHQTVFEHLYPGALVEDVRRKAEDQGRRVRVLRCARVKKYSPGVVHAVLDAVIT